MRSLKIARKAKGLSLAQLSARTGIHPVSLARAERPRQDVRVSTLAAIAKGLGVPVCELVDEGEKHERHRRKRTSRR